MWWVTLVLRESSPGANHSCRWFYAISRKIHLNIVIYLKKYYKSLWGIRVLKFTCRITSVNTPTFLGQGQPLTGFLPPGLIATLTPPHAVQRHRRGWPCRAGGTGSCLCPNSQGTTRLENPYG